MFRLLLVSISLFLVQISSFPLNDSILLPPPTGPYQTNLKISELVDNGREDPFNSSHVRRLMVSRFDPVRSENCPLLQTVPYMTSITAKTEDDVLAPYGVPTGIFDKLKLQVCEASQGELEHSKNSSSSVTAPTVLFSPGLNTTRLFYNVLAQTVASHGYSVITIDHPYDTDVVEFPDGTVIYGGAVQLENASLQHAIDVRVTDFSFVLDVLGIPFSGPVTESAVMFGHSSGGAATAAAMLNDTRIRGGVNLDGAMFGPVLNAGLGRPGIHQSFLLWGSEGHNTTTDESWGQFWATLDKWSTKEWKRELSLKNSVHNSFWDLPLLADVAGFRDQLPEESMKLIGPIAGKRVMDILGVYLSAFFGFVYTDETAGLLEGPSAQYPEVLFLN